MRRIIWRHVPESQSQRLQLERSDLDIAFQLAPADLASLQNADGIEIQTVPSAGFYYLAMSMKDERFQNPKVREAMRYLIDYKGVNDAILPFYGTEHQRPVSGGFLGLLDDPGYTFDPEKAKALLAEAGYADGMNITLRALSDDPFLNLATALQGTLGQGGMVGTIPNFPIMALIAKEIQLVGSFRFTHEFNTAVEWLAKGVVKPLPLFSGEFDLQDIDAALQFAGDKTRAAKVQLTF